MKKFIGIREDPCPICRCEISRYKREKCDPLMCTAYGIAQESGPDWKTEYAPVAEVVGYGKGLDHIHLTCALCGYERIYLP